jgi:superfamily II DNA helicase RecQ
MTREEAELPEQWTLLDLCHLGRLERRGSSFVLPAPLDREGAQRALDSRQGERAAADRDRLTQMVNYASLGECRTAHLLRYFGDPSIDHCDQCDNCDERRGRVVHRGVRSHRS